MEQAVSRRGESDLARPLRTRTARRRRLRPRLTPQLLGLGVVILTIIPAYLASGLATTRGAAPTASAGSTSRDALGQSLDSHIRDVAARYRVPASLVLAIIEAESEFDPQAVSRRGARGLMQLMPATAAMLGVSDPFDPRENIEAGVRHLRGLMNRFGNNLPLALAAYNAGPHTVISYGGIPPYRETRQYVRRILRRLDRDRVKPPAKVRRGRDA